MPAPPADPAALFAFLRALIDLDSTSGREEPAARFVRDFLQRAGLAAELWPLDEPGRANLWATAGAPRVVLSTHLDTVPPFFASSEDDERIHGRGACDAKGIVAAQVFAALELLRGGIRDFGLLFLAGEEKNSAGARAANQRPMGAQFLVNGEPTGGRMATAGKGALRVELRARGKMAHSAYPELGESAIEKLLLALAKLRALELPRDPRLGPTTYNIGVISGGRAPNVVPDAAMAELLFRLVSPAEAMRQQISAAVAGYAETQFVLEIPPVFPLVLPGFATDTVAFTTDIPALSAWGTPLLLGPGRIELAHTDHEHIAKTDLLAGVRAYVAIVRTLLERASAAPC